MSHWKQPQPVLRPRPPTWVLGLAFAVIYIAWGTTYFAIKEGVKTLPPALFSGMRLLVAGVIIWLYLALRGQSLRLGKRDRFLVVVTSLLMFVTTFGLLTTAEQTVDSGVASILVASTPLWLAIIEIVGPFKERFSVRGWFGLVLGLIGVIILLMPDLNGSDALLNDSGPWLVLASAASAALGSSILSHGQRHAFPFVAVAYQMILGGVILVGIGLALGEASHFSFENFTATAVVSFWYLVVVGSLVAYPVYVWLLRHVPPGLVGTYAYVNPVVAVFVGWLLGGEPVSGRILSGMIVILGGMALLRTGRVRQ